MRNELSTNGICDVQVGPRRGQRPSYVADNQLMLMLLAEGHDLARMSRSAGWPARSIQVFASRHGYLFSSDGTPYQPPAFGEQPRSRRPGWSTS